MASGTASPELEVIGREGELSRLRDFVLGEPNERVVVLSGGPGVGKTTLWEAAVAASTEQGAHVLSARAAEAEKTLPFATLSDLFQWIPIEAGPDLPEPQRRALDVALLRAEPAGAPAKTRAIALGVLSVLRSLAVERPVLVAIDDVQWTDAASMEALAFAARRLDGESVRIMLARRPGRPTPLEQATASRATGLILEGLSLGAVRRLLATRLELVLSRRVVRQVFEGTLGNPLFVLELGRTLTEVGPPAIGEELALPDSLDELLGARASAAPKPRRALLAVALGGGLTVSELVELVGDDALEAAVERGLLLEEDGRLRPSHPLLAAALLKRVRARERRELHRALAEVVSEPARRARHLALAATLPDTELARIVAAGAAGALARGATQQAVELAEQALRLTPTGAAERHERVLELAEWLKRANEVSR
ncbi:MAG: AAA family ATPase, partial [Actinobacteria bacterium]|nr:AAA family ATPase [Actinomycetota bacterium]